MAKPDITVQTDKGPLKPYSVRNKGSKKANLKAIRKYKRSHKRK